MKRDNEIIWSEKYRPTKISEAVLPSKMKEMFQAMADSKEVPNMMLAGKSGIGKTTAATALLDEIGADYILESGSLNVNIDAVRTRITQFASSVSFAGGRKYVIIDEADNLSITVQMALRNFMQEYSSNCGFILTCNYPGKLDPAIHSRCPVVDFKIPKEEKPALAKEFFKRTCEILDTEGIPYDNKVVAKALAKYYPDWRRLLNELQNYAKTGSIDSGLLSTFSDAVLQPVIKFMADKDFTSVRKWVGENSDIDSADLFHNLYHVLIPVIEKDSIPQLVLILADYQYKAVFSVDKEINTTACLVEIMGEVRFL